MRTGRVQVPGRGIVVCVGVPDIACAALRTAIGIAPGTRQVPGIGEQLRIRSYISRQI